MEVGRTKKGERKAGPNGGPDPKTCTDNEPGGAPDELFVERLSSLSHSAVLPRTPSSLQEPPPL